MRLSVKLITITLLVALISTSVAFARDSYKHNNSIFIDLGGNGMFISANYSRVFIHRPRYFISTQIGVGKGILFWGMTIPHQITIDFGKNKSFLEAGVGGTFWFGNFDLFGTAGKYAIYLVSPILGYRHQFNKGFIFRIYFNPLIPLFGVDEEIRYMIKPYGGISIGYSF